MISCSRVTLPNEAVMVTFTILPSVIRALPPGTTIGDALIQFIRQNP